MSATVFDENKIEDRAIELWLAEGDRDDSAWLALSPERRELYRKVARSDVLTQKGETLARALFAGAR